MKKSAGFTLIELMIVVAIVSILLAIAIPSYNSQMQKSRRTEAKQILADLQLKQEKWRSSNATYGTSTSASTSNVPIPATSGYYTITLTTAGSATGYQYTATATGSQASDACGNLVLTMTLGEIYKTATGSGTGCW